MLPDVGSSTLIWLKLGLPSQLHSGGPPTEAAAGAARPTRPVAATASTASSSISRRPARRGTLGRSLRLASTVNERVVVRVIGRSSRWVRRPLRPTTPLSRPPLQDHFNRPARAGVRQWPVARGSLL